MAAGVEGRLEDRLQDLEHGLLHPPIHDIRDTESPFAPARLRNPDAADVSRAVTPVQQSASQRPQQTRRSCDHLVHAATVHSGCPFVPCNVPQGHRQVSRLGNPVEQPIRGDPTGTAVVCRAVLRYVQQKAPLPGCVRGAWLPAPLRAGGEREDQLTGLRLSQPISPFARPTFIGFIATTRRSDFSTGIERSSFSPRALPLPADPWRSPWVRTSNVPPPPPSIPSCLDWISGVALTGTLTRIRPALRGFTCVRCCGLSKASTPHALAGSARSAALNCRASCSCLRLTVASSRPRRGLPPPITHPCQAHPARSARLRSVAGLPPASPSSMHPENSSTFCFPAPYTKLRRARCPRHVGTEGFH